MQDLKLWLLTVAPPLVCSLAVHLPTWACQTSCEAVCEFKMLSFNHGTPISLCNYPKTTVLFSSCEVFACRSHVCLFFCELQERKEWPGRGNDSPVWFVLMPLFTYNNNKQILEFFWLIFQVEQSQNISKKKYQTLMCRLPWNLQSTFINSKLVSAGLY